MHGCLIEALVDFGAAARLCERGATANTADEPFLCFQRRSPGDAPLGDQEHLVACPEAAKCRRAPARQPAWRASPAAPELPGVAELADRPIPLDTLVASWIDGLANRLEFSWRPDNLDDAEARLSKELAESWYATDVGRSTAVAERKLIARQHAPRDVCGVP